MRKIHILKAIVDFLWVTLIAFFIAFFFTFIAFLLNANWISPNFKLNEIEYQSISLIEKIYLVLYFLVNGVLLIYCLNLFRKIVDLFKNGKSFDTLVSVNFQKIGNALIYLAIFDLIYHFIYRLIIITGKTGQLNFPLGLLFLLCLGFFFMILSEIFKIAKNTKQENDLTI